jgi:hypothetical protein
MNVVEPTTAPINDSMNKRVHFRSNAFSFFLGCACENPGPAKKGTERTKRDFANRDIDLRSAQGTQPRGNQDCNASLSPGGG